MVELTVCGAFWQTMYHSQPNYHFPTVSLHHCLNTSTQLPHFLVSLLFHYPKAPLPHCSLPHCLRASQPYGTAPLPQLFTAQLPQQSRLAAPLCHYQLSQCPTEPMPLYPTVPLPNLFIATHTILLPHCFTAQLSHSPPLPY